MRKQEVFIKLEAIHSALQLQCRSINLLFCFQFFYKTDFSQLKFLQLYSEGARQHVAYHCLNSEAYGTRLMLYTGDELDTVETKYKKSTRLYTTDECVSTF